MRSDSRAYFDFYLDEEDELVRLVRGMDRLAFQTEWRVKVGLARMLLGFGLRLVESTRQVLDDCLPHYIWVPTRKNTRKGQNKRNNEGWVEPWPVFLPHYQEYVLWARNWLTVASPYLFPQVERRRLTPISVRMARYWWYEVIEEIGVRPLAPHAARRTHATWADEWFAPASANPWAAGSNLGHSDTKITQDHYRRQIPGRRYNHPKPAWVTAAEESAATLEKKMLTLPWCDEAAMTAWRAHERAFLRPMKQVDGRRKQNDAVGAVT